MAGRLFPGSLSPGLLLAIACTITYLTRWKERGTIRFIPDLVHNLASALALRAPSSRQMWRFVVILIRSSLFLTVFYWFTGSWGQLILNDLHRCWNFRHRAYSWGGGPRVVVSTAAFHARVRGSVPGLGGLKETKLFLPHPRVKVSTVGSLRDREVACSASDRQGSSFESCVWRKVSSQSSHHPQEVLLAQFSLYVHKGGLKPEPFLLPTHVWAAVVC